MIGEFRFLRRRVQLLYTQPRNQGYLHLETESRKCSYPTSCPLRGCGTLGPIPAIMLRMIAASLTVQLIAVRGIDAVTS